MERENKPKDLYLDMKINISILNNYINKIAPFRGRT